MAPTLAIQQTQNVRVDVGDGGKLVEVMCREEKEREGDVKRRERREEEETCSKMCREEKGERRRSRVQIFKKKNLDHTSIIHVI